MTAESSRSRDSGESPRVYTIDFQELKEQATFEPVLEHYRLQATIRGDRARLLCPFHNDREPSFEVNLAKKIWQCFGCRAKGNVLDFVQRMESGSSRVTLPQAAKVLVEICGLELGKSPRKPAERPGHPSASTPPPRAQEGPGGLPGARKEAPLAENQPLTLTLKLDQRHPYLAERGLSDDTIQHFGLGHCSRGMMAGRVCIPIHNEKGELVAYAGRWPGEGGWPKESGKYILPPQSKFAKELVLFNLHRVKSSNHLVIVEGFFDAMWLAQESVPAVALMGTHLSDAQLDLLLEWGSRFETPLLVLMMDGNAPGRQAAATILPRLARHFYVRDIVLPDGIEPDGIDPKRYGLGPF